MSKQIISVVIVLVSIFSFFVSSPKVSAENIMELPNMSTMTNASCEDTFEDEFTTVLMLEKDTMQNNTKSMLLSAFEGTNNWQEGLTQEVICTDYDQNSGGSTSYKVQKFTNLEMVRL
jgi:hypothetical protein